MRGDSAPLLPIFSVAFDRQSRRVRLDESLIDIRIDHGEIIAGGVREPVSDLELALVDGEPARLFELGLTLAGEYGLRPALSGKSGRGRALARGAGLAHPPPVYAEKVGLAPGDTVGEALSAVFRSCCAQIEGNEPCARDGSDDEGVHQMRVAIRRMRSALTAFNAALPPALAGQLTDDLGALMDALGPARDLDVFMAETAAPLSKRLPEDTDLATLFRHAETERGHAYAALRDVMDRPVLPRLLLLAELWRMREAARDARAKQARKLVRAAKKAADKAAKRAPTPGPSTTPLMVQPDLPPPLEPARSLPRAAPAMRENPGAFAELLDEPAEAVAAQALDKRWKRLIRAGEAVEDGPVEALHDLRLLIKKLRYAAEFFAELYPSNDAKPFLKPLKRLQDSLGLVQDAVVAQDLAAGIAGRAMSGGGPKRRFGRKAADQADRQAMARAAGLIAGWRIAHADDQAEDAMALWKAFKKAKPFWR